ncbi:hypothetical protein DFJ74DRAFT_709942 [Hyaloraphidium curvatum]|nr:hypothetical protein DFJ74DRAFT_709942 [Hyaloraphidium curvatum]
MSDADPPAAARTPGPRSAEKPRVSTCPFADRAANCAISSFRSSLALLPPDLRLLLESGQTVLAAVLATDSSGGMECLAWGCGTRVLPDSMVAADTEGTRVADMHAEILARRAFSRLLMEETCQSVGPGVNGSPGHGTPLLLRDPSSPFPRLNPALAFHIYTSSAPCGNACIRRWASPLPSPPLDLPETEWPAARHPPFHPVGKKEGQLAVLCKSDPTLPPDPTAPLRPPFPPPGTAPRAAGWASSRASCSDKLLLRCALGLQGGLASSLLAPGEAARPASLVCGRKFLRPHLERAVCCRASSFLSKHSLAHPVVLCTAVKLDGGLYEAGRGAEFGFGAGVWYRGLAEPEVLDGRTGKVFTTGVQGEGGESAVSRAAMLACWVRAASCLGLVVPRAATDPQRGFADRYAAAKGMAAGYGEAKGELLVGWMPDWPRRRAREGAEGQRVVGLPLDPHAPS